MKMELFSAPYFIIPALYLAYQILKSKEKMKGKPRAQIFCFALFFVVLWPLALAVKFGKWMMGIPQDKDSL